jgi:hypothetical protein
MTRGEIIVKTGNWIVEAESGVEGVEAKNQTSPTTPLLSRTFGF